MKELKDLQVGDEVIVESFYGKRIDKVQRITKTCLVISNVKYKKDTGTEYGYHGYHPSRVKVATEELKAEVLEENNRKYMIGTIQTFNFKSLSTDKLKQVYDIIKSEDNEGV